MARWRSIPKRCGALLHICFLSVMCAAQTPAAKPSDPSPCQPASAPDKQCPPSTVQKKPPTAAEQFPFPGDPETQAPKASTPNAPAPTTPRPDAPHPSAASEHPFPGDAPSPPANSGSSSSSSSSSSDDGASAPPTAGDDHPWNDKGDNPKAETRRKLPKVENLQSDEERATEDLKIAKFYEQSGSLSAAYLRAKDAVKYQPNDPDTHFALAHIAQKLNKKDEAIAEFNTYLKLDPDGLKIKDAQKALNQLQK